MSDCKDCESKPLDVEEYCPYCTGEIVCFDCLDSEWCASCIELSQIGQEIGEYE